jgi:hypothetical protein
VLTNENNNCLIAFHVKNMGEEQTLWLKYTQETIPVTLRESPMPLLGYGKKNGDRTMV